VRERERERECGRKKERVLRKVCAGGIRLAVKIQNNYPDNNQIEHLIPVIRMLRDAFLGSINFKRLRSAAPSSTVATFVLIKRDVTSSLLLKL
jgi:hypothetical protein